MDLGGVRFATASVTKQLRQDLKDDWFPDPVGFWDMPNLDSAYEMIANNVVGNDGVYAPSERCVFDIPKANFTLRYALETGLPDRLVYHATVSHLLPHFDAIIPWYVFSHRHDPLRSSDRYLFRQAVQAWKDFTGSVRADLRAAEWLLTTDLTNYYENISLDKLRFRLEDELPALSINADTRREIESQIALLFNGLNCWSFERGRGLPQNRDASSFLANMYMLPVDREMRRKGYRYYRYMDDIKVVCTSEYEARRALRDLSLCLRSLGLAVNSKKTEIIPAIRSAEVAACLDSGTPEIETLDRVWRTRNIHIIRRSFPLLRELALATIRSGQIDSREARFLFGRLRMLGRCTEFEVPSSYFEPITDELVARMVDHPAATDQICGYLALVPIAQHNLEIIEQQVSCAEYAIYDWKNHRLWHLLTRVGHRTPALWDAALAAATGTTDDATRAASSIYLGSLGGTPERRAISEAFRHAKSYLGQRSALLALQELPYKPHIRDHVAPHVRTDLLGTYRALRSKPARYFEPIDPVPLSRLVDEGVSYA